MKKNIVWCKTDEETKGYKYIAVIWESAGSYGKLYASNNLRDLKSFVYNQVRQLYSDASGNIYYALDRHLDNPVYICWRDYSKTYSQNQY